MRLEVLPINGCIHRYSDSVSAKMCPMCKTYVENLQHFLLECPLYSKLRLDICPNVFSMPLEKIVDMRSRTNTKVLGKFVFLALKMRSKALEIMADV